MSRVRRLGTDYGDLEDPEWEQAKEILSGIPDGRTVSVDADDEHWLIVLHIAELGYLVTGSQEGDGDYFTLIDRSLGDDPVTAFDGGNTHEYPRFSFVDYPMMLQAVETFFRSGHRDKSFEWVPEEDAVYD